MYDNIEQMLYIVTKVYPGFATDLQQPLTALLTQAEGQSKVMETIYSERFKHCFVSIINYRSHTLFSLRIKRTVRRKQKIG